MTCLLVCLFVTDGFVCRVAVTKPVGTAGTPVTAVVKVKFTLEQATKTQRGE